MHLLPSSTSEHDGFAVFDDHLDANYPERFRQHGPEINLLKNSGKNLVSFRFGVLYHQMPADSGRASHWDLLLEQPPEPGSGLLTFEVSVPPKEWGNSTFVRKLPNHRPLYLHYEGPLSDDRGIVTRILAGTIQWKVQTLDLLVIAVQSDTLPSAFSSGTDRDFKIQGELKISKLDDQINLGRWKMEYTQQK